MLLLLILIESGGVFSGHDIAKSLRSCLKEVGATAGMMLIAMATIITIIVTIKFCWRR